MLAKLSVSAQIPWPANAASPWMIIGKMLRTPSAPVRSCHARARPITTGSTASRWLGFEARCSETTLPFAVFRSPVAPMWYFTSPPPIVVRGSTSSNFEKISCDPRPTVFTITFSRPRWLIANTERVTPLSAAVVNS